MFSLKDRVYYNTTSPTSVCLTVFALSAALGWMLPPDYGKENGPVELLQVVVLGLAAAVAVSALFQSNLPPSRRKLYALSSIIWLIAIARELSWGRTFYVTSSGSIPPLKTLWFGPLVYPTIGVIVIIAFGYFFTQGLHKELFSWLKYDTIPVLDIVIVIAAIFIADMIEHHSLGLFGQRTTLLEELGELVSYCGILSFMINIIYNKRFGVKGNHLSSILS
ncbi:hypothetical protein [Sporomusa malonica]|uniref:Uncharacterized protein n=1 Tax=Sporomusa malonica TaxID=112901 RepID=A0A1W1YSI1_9FIRM|nr:hypothetical protein [Sporomusa malonica]SMC39109.1 hypothetical protein SAMN04488500_102151 [Sporomusa malonica]